MTTLAYKNGELAADSQVTSDGIKLPGKYKKLFKNKRIAVCFCGCFTTGNNFANDLLKSYNGKKITIQECIERGKFLKDDAVIILTKTKCFFSCNGGVLEEITNKIYAEGSGHQLAYGAMEAGKSAKEAVSIACKYDIQSAPPIVTINQKELI